MLTTLALLALITVALVLIKSRKADIEGRNYDEASAAHAKGGQMIPDAIDWTDERNLERQEF